ncbi:MAG: DUF1700 domain-containing protein [Clostridiales bacterium]|nr:DUF1700 domain-containing protein [Candidatus Blautia equi]
MTREQFMGKLIDLLSEIPEQERQDAILFFESYFEEAGPGEEQAVIAKLGTPEKVAAQIRANLEESNEEYAEYSETGYEDVREPKLEQLPEVRYSKNNSKVILAIIALIFLAPLIKGIFSGVIGVIVTIVLLPFLVVFALGAASIGLLVGGIACIVAGIPLCFASLPLGILTIGVGCLIGALGLASLVLMVSLAGKWLPKIFAFITNRVSSFAHRKERAAR